MVYLKYNWCFYCEVCLSYRAPMSVGLSLLLHQFVSDVLQMSSMTCDVPLPKYIPHYSGLGPMFYCISCMVFSNFYSKLGWINIDSKSCEQNWNKGYSAFTSTLLMNCLKESIHNTNSVSGRVMELWIKPNYFSPGAARWSWTVLDHAEQSAV